MDREKLEERATDYAKGVQLLFDLPTSPLRKAPDPELIRSPACSESRPLRPPRGRTGDCSA
jgi:hypothetical protein